MLNFIVNKENNPIPSKHIGNAELFTKEVIAYSVVAFKDNTLYAKSLDQLKLFKSTDGGKTFAEIWTSTGGTIVAVHVTSTGALIVFTTTQQGTQQGSVFYSADGVTFTKTLDTIATPLNSMGVSSNGGIVCFGEYQLTNGQPVRIYRSADNGQTWTVTLTIGNSSTSAVRHVHSCQYIVPANGFIATTGDAELKWYHSYDGITWVQLFSTTSQARRTLSVIGLRRNELIWTTDAGNGYEGVFSSYISDNRLMYANDINRLFTLPKTSYAAAGNGNVIIATTRSTSGYTVNKNVSAFVSIDCGTSFREEINYTIRDGVVDGGFFDCIGPDKNGKYYLSIDGAVGIADRSTVILTPNFSDKHEDIIDRALNSNNDVITVFDSVSKTTTALEQRVVDLTKYKEIIVYCKNSHDQNATLNIDLKSGDRPFIWNGSAFVIDRQISIPGLNASAAYLLNTKFTWLSKAVGDSIAFELSFATAPTTGSFTLIIIGIKK